MKRTDINIRDPFVLVHGGRYYLYGTRGATCWGMADGFDVYTGDDLENWEGPHECFHRSEDFFADRNFWAPEVYEREDGFYMFASFKNEHIHRGTAVLKADSPLGPFRLHSNGCVTPPDWDCLDGTLYTDEKGGNYMVFCHEWVQAGDGEICAVRLSDDLYRAEGEPILLFRASCAPWKQEVHHSSSVTGYVTDGPFLHRTEDGTLLCLWAGFSRDGYTQAVARSETGRLEGPYVQETPLFLKDGGHGMVFRGLDGRLYLTLHSPNEKQLERPCFYPLEERNGRLERDE